MFNVGAGEGRQCVAAWSPMPGPHLATRVQECRTRVPGHTCTGHTCARPHVCRPTLNTDQGEVRSHICR